MKTRYIVKVDLDTYWGDYWCDEFDDYDSAMVEFNKMLKTYFNKKGNGSWSVVELTEVTTDDNDNNEYCVIESEWLTPESDED